MDGELLAEKAKRLSMDFNAFEWRKQAITKLILKHASKGEFRVVWTKSWDKEVSRWLQSQGFKLEQLCDVENERFYLSITWRKL